MTTDFDVGTLANLKKTAENIDQRMKRYEQYFNVPKDKLVHMMDEFVDELHRGLKAFQAHPYIWKPEDCSFKMLDSCVDTLPTGNERGVAYGLDFGGTNFRAVRVELLGDSNLKIDDVRQSVVDHKVGDKYITDRDSTATDMFNFFALTLKTLMDKKGDSTAQRAESAKSCDYPEKKQSDNVLAGFTFSFPCAQKNLRAATLVEWTKGFETGRGTNDPVEGCDVCSLMDVAFTRNKMDVCVGALLNDTVGTLLSCAYTMDHKKHPRCLAGMILGTGVNVCYVERNAAEFGYKGSIINIESGNFDRALPQTNVDLEVDFAASSNRGKQRLEKMLSGAYLGELCRRTFVKVLQHRAPADSWLRFCLSSAHCSSIIADTSPNRVVAQKLLTKLWQVEDPTQQVADILYTICRMVFKRSAALAAVKIAAVAKQTGHLQAAMGGVSVAIDGSLYKCVPFYRDEVRAHLDLILGNEVSQLIHLLLADDGSGKGAAILAGTLQNCSAGRSVA